MYFWYLNALIKKIWTQFVAKGSPKHLGTIIVLSFQNYIKLRIDCLFLYTELWNYMFQDRL